MGESLQRVFRAYGRDFELVKVALPKAIEGLRGPELLFREDTIYTEIATEFVRTHGLGYLRKALKAPLKRVTDRAMTEDFDIDPTRVPKPEDQAANATRLTEAADLILESLAQRIDKYLPSIVNDAIGILVDTAVAKFGLAARHIACTVFFFMRFVCPAIVNPAKFEITGKITKPSVTRALLTLSKLIKACAEGATEMGGNARIGEYLATAKPRIDSFYLSLCRVRERKATLDKRESNAVIPSLHILRHLQSKMSILSVELNHRGAQTSLKSLEELVSAMGTERPRRPSSTTVTGMLENWPTERVLLWLECLGLEEHKLSFSRHQISGRMLLNMDPPGLAQLGVLKEVEQWRILQSIQDLNSLEARYANAEKIAATYDPRPFPPMQRLMTRDVSKDTLLENGIFLVEEDDDDSISSTSSSGSPAIPQAFSSPPAAFDSVIRRSSGSYLLPRSGSGPPDDLPFSAALATSSGYECVFRCMMPNGTTRVVRGNSAEGWAGFQHRVREELKVARAAFTYVDPAQTVVAVEDDLAFRQFLATNGTRTPGQPTTYRLVLGL